MLSLKNLNSALTGLSNRINFDTISNAAVSARDELSSTQTTRLGVTAGEVVGGFQSLTQEVDNGSTEVVGGGMSLMVGNPDGTQIIQDISSSNLTDLNAITGLTMSSGLNKTVVTASTPEAIGATTATVADKPLSVVEGSMKAVSVDRFSASAGINVIKNLLEGGIGKAFTDLTGLTLRSRQDWLNTGIDQTVKDVIEVVESPIDNAIDKATQDSGKIVPKQTRQRVASFIDQSNYKAAAELVFPLSTKSVVELETDFSVLDTSVKKAVKTTDQAYDGLGTSTATIQNIGDKDTEWNGKDTKSDYIFTTVNSLEELEAEIRSATREITEVVLHWTANFIDQAHIGSDEIHKVHKQRGFSGIGYHYIIKRDGTIQRGRPLNLRGAHARDFGHNTYSIGLSHVAGYNCVSGTRNPDQYVSSESISTAQWKAQKDFLNVFYRVHSGGQVLGHNQCSTTGKVDPGFDVDAYIKNTFNKTNALVYDNDNKSLSTADLIAQRVKNSL